MKALIVVMPPPAPLDQLGRVRLLPRCDESLLLLTARALVAIHLRRLLAEHHSICAEATIAPAEERFLDCIG